MLTLLEIVRRSTDFLARHGVENPRLNAEHLIGHALGLGRMQLYLQFERPLAEAELGRIRPLVKRRSEREPLQYILGTVEFGGLTLKVDRRALIPRPETERLLELALAAAPAGPLRILDLGTGSGALALALARARPEAAVTGVDREESALALARENAAASGLADRVAWVRSDWFRGVPEEATFDLIVANPPYLADTELAGVEPEVRDHEPRSALTSGPRGTEDLESILRDARGRLRAGGALWCETGPEQHAHLLAFANTAGYGRAESHRDLTGRERFLVVSA
jgi:release factor glutamine methyltransferase